MERTEDFAMKRFALFLCVTAASFAAGWNLPNMFPKPRNFEREAFVSGFNCGMYSGVEIWRTGKAYENPVAEANRFARTNEVTAQLYKLFNP
jgi:hypothetical protein